MISEWSHPPTNPLSFAWRGCWSPKYEEGRYNFTIDDKTGVTCETGQHCMFGECHDSTVCLCKDNLCNDFQVLSF